MASLGTESALVFVCLSLIYGITTIFCVLRFIRIHRFTTEWKQSKVFYVSIFLQVAIRTLSFIIFIFSTGMHDGVIFVMISMPDSLFVVSYILLIWQFFSVFLFTYQDPSFRSFLMKPQRKRKQRIKFSYVLIFFIAVWVPLQVFLYLIYLFGQLNSSNISKELGIVNFCLPSFCISLMIYLNVKFSGVPARSPIWRQKYNRICCVTLFWSLTRIARGVFNILSEFSDPFISNSIANESENITSTAIWILILIISEVACIFLVLDYSFIGIFLFSEEEFTSGLTQGSKDDLEDKEESKEVLNSMISSNPFIKQQEIELGEIVSEHPKKLGQLIRGVFCNRDIIYRKIEFSRLSKYIVQEIIAEIETYQRLSTRQIAPVYGIVIDFPTLGIVTPYYPESLFTFLRGDSSEISMKEQIILAKEISKALLDVHSQGKVHGHLTSHNILISHSKQICIADLGFYKVKKYAAILFSYTTKSSWSSPEILKDRRLIPVKTYEYDDIYSLGVIFWEIVTRQEPFVGYSLKQLEEKVATEGLRPFVPPDIDSDFSQLILSCWNTEPTTRPQVELVHSTLDDILKKY